MTKLIAVANPEKLLHESWDTLSKDGTTREMFNFPRPFRWAVFGTPNSGKSTMILNYLVKASPYDRIFLLHPRSYNPEVSEADMSVNKNLILAECEIPEYAGVEFFPMAYIPNEKFFENLKGFTLFIIDDIDLISMSKGSKMKARIINKFFSYVSTHCNVSVIVTSQSPSSQLPSIVFQMCNVASMFRIKDRYKLLSLAQKMGENLDYLENLMKICKDRHDSITFDNTDDSPYPIRKNIFTKIIIKE